MLGNLDGDRARGALTPSRVPELVLTLERNRQWWTSGPLLAADQRVGFPGSGARVGVLPGPGDRDPVARHLRRRQRARRPAQPGRPRGAARRGDRPRRGARRRHRLGVRLLASTAARRRGSARSRRAPRSQALARAAARARGRRPTWRRRTRRSAIFAAPPPVGVRSATAAGARYLIYSFAPHEFVINAFIQSLVGLFDLASAGDPLAGDACSAPATRRRSSTCPSYNTGYWSLYDQYSESSLSYHELLIGFLANLCARTSRDRRRRRSRSSAARTGATGTDRRERVDRRERDRPARPARPATGTGGRPRERRDRARPARRGPTGASGRPARRGTTGTTGHDRRDRHDRHDRHDRADRRDRADRADRAGAGNVYCTTAAAFTADLHADTGR